MVCGEFFLYELFITRKKELHMKKRTNMPDERSVKTNLILQNGAKMLSRKHDDFPPSSSEL